MKLLQKLKDRLIKWLGGYTREEYNDCSRIPIAKPDFRVIARPERLVSLSTERIVYYEEIAVLGRCEAELRTRQKIAEELTKQALPYIAWEQTENRENMAIRVRGTLHAVEAGCQHV